MKKILALALVVYGLLLIVAVWTLTVGLLDVKLVVYWLAGLCIAGGIWLFFARPDEEERRPEVRPLQYGEWDPVARVENNLNTAALLILIPGVIFALAAILFSFTSMQPRMSQSLEGMIARVLVLVPVVLAFYLLAAGILTYRRNSAGLTFFYLGGITLLLMFPFGTIYFFVIRHCFNKGEAIGNLYRSGRDAGIVIGFILPIVLYSSSTTMALWIENVNALDKQAAHASFAQPPPPPAPPSPPLAAAPAPAPEPTGSAPPPPPPLTPAQKLWVGTEEATREALRLYPALNQKGSPLQVKFAERVKYLQANDPGYFLDKTWPLALAQELAAQEQKPGMAKSTGQ
jgi:hypothetical protein